MFTALLSNLLAFVAGIAIGQAIDLTHRKWNNEGREHWTMRLNVKWIRSRWVIFMMLVIFLMSVAEIVYFSYHQRSCNIQFQEAILASAQINKEDRALETRDDNIRDELDAAENRFYRALVSAPPPGLPPAQYTQSLIEDYVATQDRLKEIRSDLRTERDELEIRRKQSPYPDPLCD